MKNPLGAGNGMVPHYSGTTLDAQARYANGTKSILENYLTNKDQEPQVRCVNPANLAMVCQSGLLFAEHHRRQEGLRDQGLWPALRGFPSGVVRSLLA